MRRASWLVICLLPGLLGCGDIKIHFPGGCPDGGCDTGGAGADPGTGGEGEGEGEGEDSGSGDSASGADDSGSADDSGGAEDPDEVSLEDWDTRSDDPVTPEALSCDDVGADLDRPDDSLCARGVAAWLLSDNSRYNTVQEAIDAAGPRDVVTICPGTWEEHLSLITTESVELELRGYGPGETVLSGAGSGRILEADQVGTLTLRGLSVRDGLDTDGAGLALHGDDTILDGVLLEDNHATYSGGGLIATGTSLLIGDTCLRGNQADYEGGGATLMSETAIGIEASVFESNEAVVEGGGLKYGGMGGPVRRPVIVGTTFLDNRAGDAGGAIRMGDFDNTELYLRDSVLEGNSAGSGGAVQSSSWGSGGLHLRQTALSDNEATDTGGAIVQTGAGVQSGVYTDCWFIGNNGADGAALSISAQEGNDVTVQGGQIIENLASGADGSAATISAEGTLRFDDVDLGVDGTDNLPHDVQGSSGYGAGTSLSCTSSADEVSCL